MDVSIQPSKIAKDDGGAVRCSGAAGEGEGGGAGAGEAGPGGLGGRGGATGGRAEGGRAAEGDRGAAAAMMTSRHFLSRAASHLLAKLETRIGLFSDMDLCEITDNTSVCG